jgi:hypothetical protein
MLMKTSIFAGFLLCAAFAAGQTPAPSAQPPEERARVFVTDSTSWETKGGGGGANGTWGAASHGGARPQTAEIIKTFGERCPQIQINNKQDFANYIVVLDHEGGKGFLSHKNKVAVFERVSGDAIVSHSTLSLGGSVQEACGAIAKHWSEHGADLRAAALAAAKPASAATPQLMNAAATIVTPKIAMASNPDGAEIEIDGVFVGTTPSAIEVTQGEHLIAVKKSGFKSWERKMRVTGGDIRVNAELEKK